MKRRALLTVSEKKGLVAFAQGLAQLDFEVISTGGTAQELEKAGLQVTKVSEVTGFPEILGGRLKTLHPKIFGGILARRDVAQDQKETVQQEILPFDLVCVNLYPFEKTVSRGPTPLPEALEQVDIGGPSLIRAAAKNYREVWVVVDSEDYSAILKALTEGKDDPALRFHLAAKAFAHTACYDGMISQYLHGFARYEDCLHGSPKLEFPTSLHLHFSKIEDLRYGENPHQKGAYFGEGFSAQAPWEKLHGKELSFNNILDAHAAWACLQEFSQPATVIVKHTNPCGVAVHEDLAQAFQDAMACDSVSAFGGIVACNRRVEASLAGLLAAQFFEVLLAPEFSAEALAILTKKKNVRILRVQSAWDFSRWDLKRVGRGILVQDADTMPASLKSVPDLRVVTQRSPTEMEWQALEFSWSVVRHVKSNAIVLVQAQKTVGIGAGQMSRVDASKLASLKAQACLRGKSSQLVLASDAFFPFRDGIDAAAEAGVTAVVQPGGSVRDEEVIQAANEHDMSMIFTGRRYFRH